MNGGLSPATCRHFVFACRLLRDWSGRYYNYCQKGQFRGQPSGAEFPVMENPTYNPTYNRKRDGEYKRLVCNIDNAVEESIRTNKSINLVSLLSNLNIGSKLSIRRTFSKDAMLKAYILFKLKRVKSYNALSNYLRNRPDEAIILGFDKKDDNTVNIPTHQNMSHFVRSLNDEDARLVNYIMVTITKLAEKYGIALDTEARKRNFRYQSPKSAYNHKTERIVELVSFIKKRLLKKSGLDSRYNAVYRNGELIEELIWLGFGHDFAESGCRTMSALTGRKLPSADTLLYHIKKLGFEHIESIFSEFIDLTIRNARQKGIITDRAADVAIDVTPAWRFYGSIHDKDGNRLKGLAGYKQERGTSFAYQFISLDVVEHNERVTLMALPVFHRGDQNSMVEKLLTYAKEKIAINRVLLDRGFFDSECIKMLNRMGLKYIMPAKTNSIDVRKVSRLSAPRIVPNCAMKSCRFNLVVAEIKGEKRYFATNLPIKSDDLIYAFRIGDMYRRRWQIETGYRTKKYTFLPKTTSKNYAIRYFYFMMSVVLYNYWVIADIAVMLYLGLNTKKVQITARMFCIRLIEPIREKPGG